MFEKTKTKMIKKRLDLIRVNKRHLPTDFELNVAIMSALIIVSNLFLNSSSIVHRFT